LAFLGVPQCPFVVDESKTPDTSTRRGRELFDSCYDNVTQERKPIRA
jgi:hypothetical protein